MTIQTATLAGGCFWCLEAIFDELQGVEDVVSGYMGGTGAPNYEAVCGGNTGHAEVIQIRFEDAVISYRDVLEIFFAMHDPTTLNRQGNDVGTQYRSAIFCHSAEQLVVAQSVVKNLDAAALWSSPIVTQVSEATTFFPAEEYHQEYFKRNPNQGYCMAVVNPKVSKFRQKFTSRLKR